MDIVQTIRSRISGSGFSGVAVLMTSTVGTQLVALLCSPLVSRLFAPATFGRFAIFLSVAALISVVITLRYEQALPLEQGESDANVLALSTIAIAVVLSVVAMAGVPFVAYRLMGLDAGTGNSTWLLPAAALGAALNATSQVLYFLMLRRAQYRGIAAVRVIGALVSNAVFIGLGFLGWGLAGMLTGYLAGVGLTLGAYFWMTDLGRDWRGIWNRNRARELLAKHRRFPIFIMPSALLSTMGVHLSNLLCARVFSVHDLGVYSFAMRMVDLPGAFLSVAISDVFYREASRCRQDRLELRRLVLDYIKKLLFFAVPVYGLIGLLAGVAVPFVFGEQWRESGRVIQVMTPMNLVSFVVSPIASLATTAKDSTR